MINSRTFQPGEMIVKENEAGEEAYYIESGKVEISRIHSGKKIHLAELNAGAIFGEMSLIDDKPRSATVTALNETVIKVIHRDDFFRSFTTEPEFSLQVLKQIFERLREANILISQLQTQDLKSKIKEAPASVSHVADGRLTVYLTGLTKEAEIAMPNNPFKVQRFPFYIGRSSEDPLVNNDLGLITQSLPLQVSRHHIKIIEENGRIGITDRGSTLGTQVNGKTIGGKHNSPGPIYIDQGEGEVWLGNSNTSFRYNLRVTREKTRL